MANGLFWFIWVVAALVTGAVMVGAWTGPHRTVSNLSRWATRLGLSRMPDWLVRRSADRWGFRGGLVSLVLLVAAIWLAPSQRAAETPVQQGGAPAAPKPPEQAVIRPERHLDGDLKNAIRVHIPKTKQIRIVVLSGDNEADQFAWEIDAFVRAEGYQVAPRLLFAMAAGGTTPVGTSLYPDEKDPNIVVIRVGLNDRN
jgi:hypothetical protein